jgi:aspartyl aminopeptidase
MHTARIELERALRFELPDDRYELQYLTLQVVGAFQPQTDARRKQPQRARVDADDPARAVRPGELSERRPRFDSCRVDAAVPRVKDLSDVRPVRDEDEPAGRPGRSARAFQASRTSEDLADSDPVRRIEVFDRDVTGKHVEWRSIVGCMTAPSGSDAVSDLVRFIDASPTPYHAVAEVSSRLRAAGFRELDEGDEWSVTPSDRIFVVRGGGTLVALHLGSAPPSRAGFVLGGAHTDSPGLRIKPNPDVISGGQRQVGVEVYGSPLLHTWLDRDLGVAGRVSLRTGGTHLVRFDRPICRISNLAIHLSPTLVTEGLKLNPQLHAVPSLGLDDGRTRFVEIILAELSRRGTSAAAADIGAYDLSLYDVQGAAVGGSESEFLFSARLDNLASCHALTSVLTGLSSDARATRGIVLYDHEEVGSQSASGASSLFLRSVLGRVAAAFPDAGSEALERALARSVLASVDMAHAVHPGYADKHDPQHSPRLGGGPVIKANANQSYATDAPGAALFERACHEAGFAPQRFVSRNDMRCGSTIGPISAARLAIRTVDVGNPMLSMHSCREVSGTQDVDKMIRALTRFFEAKDVPSSTA